MGFARSALSRLKLRGETGSEIKPPNAISTMLCSTTVSVLAAVLQHDITD